MKHFVVDRFEKNFAVAEDDDGKMFDISLSNLPKGIKQGDVLAGDGQGGFRLDAEETRRRTEQTEKLMSELLREKP